MHLFSRVIHFLFKMCVQAFCAGPDELSCLDRLQEALRNNGIEALFPVQVAVWNETVGPGSCERDLCVCSPTGSGKTLSYALPIVQKLSTRVIRRLRALVVLPTRDLATQVRISASNLLVFTVKI